MFGGVKNVGHLIGYGALAYGLYRLIKRRRVGIMEIALIAGGVWGSGLWNTLKNLLPKDASGNTNVMALAGMMFPNPTVKTIAGASAAGVGITAAGILIPLIASWLGNKLFSKKKTYRRTYSRSWRPVRGYRGYSYRRR